MRVKSEELREKRRELSVERRERLTAEELETLASLVRCGKTVYWAPIEIENDEQMEALGLTKAQCRTWHIGRICITIHLTPTDRETGEYLLADLRTKYRKEFREQRCLIPGERKNLIRCPECNRCADCPYPEVRDRYSAAPLSLDSLIERGYEIPTRETGFEQAELLDELRPICAAISAVNPKYLRAITLQSYFGLSVAEIAEEMQETPRNIYFYIEQARKIGRAARRCRSW